MPLRFLHLADLHLGAPFRMLGAREGERREDLLKAFVRAVDFALDPAQRIDAVLVAGDVFDTHAPDAALVVNVATQTRRLEAAGVPVLWIPGTHDRYDDPACVYRHEQFPGVTLLTDARFGAPLRLTIKDTDVAVSAYAFQAGLSAARPLDDLHDLGSDTLHIALFHGSVQAENLSWTVQDHYVPVTPEGIAAAPVHYLAMGHYHNPQEWPTRYGIARYPGTLEGRRFRENGERTVTVVELQAGAPPRVETHPWNRRTLKEETLNLDHGSFAERSEVVRWLHDRADANAIVRVRLTGTAEREVDLERIQAETAGGYFYLDLRDETDVFESAWIAAFAEEPSVRGEFVRRLRAATAQAEPDARPACALALKLGVQAFANHADRTH